jgi:8-oxo-dGTP pyrophosphatase MutT (NUDIX family)
MAINQPEPGAQLYDGPVTTPRAAATVVLLRGEAERLEVLLVKRNPEARFMGGAWVFPGGSVSPQDGEGQPGLQAAARRELREETGVELSSEVELVPFARWITPEAVRTRFDTWFYLAAAPLGAQARVDGEEIVDACWLAPSEALSRQAAGELFLVFPTIKQLQQLSAFESAAALLGYARGRKVEPVQPRVAGRAEQARILLPGDPSYTADA